MSLGIPIVLILVIVLMLLVRDSNSIKSTEKLHSESLCNNQDLLKDVPFTLEELDYSFDEDDTDNSLKRYLELQSGQPINKFKQNRTPAVIKVKEQLRVQA